MEFKMRNNLDKDDAKKKFVERAAPSRAVSIRNTTEAHLSDFWRTVVTESIPYYHAQIMMAEE